MSMESQELLGVALRASVMYVYVLALMRLTGKRTFGHLSPIDFVMTVMIGDFFDDVFWAEVPLAHGIVAITTLAVVHMLVEFATSKSVMLDRIVSSSKAPLIQDGHLLEQNLRRERLPRSEVLSLLRVYQKEESEIRNIKEAGLEPSSQLSVLEREEAKPAQKKDLPVLKGMYR